MPEKEPSFLQIPDRRQKSAGFDLLRERRGGGCSGAVGYQYEPAAGNIWQIIIWNGSEKPGQLEAESQAVKTFNQALWHAQNGSDDLAACSLPEWYQPSPILSKPIFFWLFYI